MTAPFTPEELRWAGERVIIATSSKISASSSALEHERRWLATADALQKRLDAAEVELARCWSVATETSPKGWPGIGAAYTEVDKLDDRADAAENRLFRAQEAMTPVIGTPRVHIDDNESLRRAIFEGES